MASTPTPYYRAQTQFTVESLHRLPIHITTIIRQPLNQEADVFDHLIHSRLARHTLYEHLETIRRYRREGVLIHHPLLTSPIRLPALMTNREFVQYLHSRFERLERYRYP